MPFGRATTTPSFTNRPPASLGRFRAHPAVFHIGGFRYDIDGRAYDASQTIPEITQMLNMQTARELGLSTQYAGPGHVRL
jgi:hypothetical protein